MAQKVIGGGQSHVTPCLHINHFCLEFNFCSNFEPSQGFRTQKSEPTQGLDT